jgi:hypothetical protein
VLERQSLPIFTWRSKSLIKCLLLYFLRKILRENTQSI